MNGQDQHAEPRMALLSWLAERKLDSAFPGLVYLRWLYVRDKIGGAQDGRIGEAVQS